VKPYYESTNVTLYHGDCLNIIPELDQVDLLITDPPYGVKWRSNRRATKFDAMAGDDSTDVGTAAIKASIERLRNHRHAYVFGPFDLTTCGVGGTAQLIWDKHVNGSGNLASIWAPSHEVITFGVKSGARRRNGTIDGALSARLRRGSVLRYQRPNGNQVRHPSEKPVGLIRELIESSSRLGEVVLDPFGGSGSTAVAALIEGRRAIVIELEEKWCQLIAKRLIEAEKAIAQADIASR